MAEANEVIDITPKDVVQFDITNMAIEQLAQKYKGLTIEPGNGDQYRAVKDGIKDIRTRRLAVDAKHKTGKAAALDVCRKWDARKNDIKDRLAPIETELKDTKAVEDDRIAKIKAAKAAVEQERIDKIRALINGISDYVNLIPTCRDSSAINGVWDEVKSITIDLETYQEYTQEADIEQRRVLNVLHDAYTRMLDQEAADAARQVEADRLEEQRVAQEAEAARLLDIANKQAAEAKAKQDAIDKDRMEAEAKLQKERDALEAEKAKIAQDKADAALAAQQEKDRQAEADRQELERIQAELAEAQADRELAEEAKREAEHAKEMLPDYEKLIDFADMVLDLHLPPVTQPKAVELANDIQQQIWNVAEELKERASRL